MNAGEIAEDGDARNVFAVEREDAGCLGTQTRGAVGRDVALYVFVVHVVGSGDLRKKPRHHLNDVCNWHRADLVLPWLCSLPGGLRSLGLEFLTGQALDMRQTLDTDATGRVRF